MPKTLAWQAFWGYQQIVKKRVRLPWNFYGTSLDRNICLKWIKKAKLFLRFAFFANWSSIYWSGSNSFSSR
ncbi:MAG: hypothetical protein WCQ26_02795, partial [Pseudanabaena sp. ELA748]